MSNFEMCDVVGAATTRRAALLDVSSVCEARTLEISAKGQSMKFVIDRLPATTALTLFRRPRIPQPLSRRGRMESLLIRSGRNGCLHLSFPLSERVVSLLRRDEL